VSDTPVRIRSATTLDAQLIADLGARTFRDTFGPDNTEADMADYLASAFGPAIQARELEDAHTSFLIAQADGSTAGYARLRFGDSPTSVGGRRPVEIVRFYVDGPWIGHGVGAVLMGASLDLAKDRGCDVVWLDVWERNPRAIAFYEKWGFVVVGSQPFLLGDDVQNDLLMSRAVG
jgi:ribosomal protein S18 acetylase RimI-like enzyme